MHSTKTFLITVSNDWVSCHARTLNRNFAHAAAVIVTHAHCCLTAAGHCYVMLRTIKFVDKSVNDNSVRRLEHCDVIASRSGFGVATDVPHSEVELQTEFKSFTTAHLGSNTNQHTYWTLGGTCIKSSRSVYAPHLVQSVRLHLFKYRGGDNAHWISKCNGRCGDRTRVADSRVQCLNHWAIKVPERPSRLHLAGSLHYSPLFEIRAPWLGPLSTKAGSFHSQANPGYRCHQCNGPCWDRTLGCRFQSPTPKPLGHKGTWTTQSLTLGWFVTPRTRWPWRRFSESCVVRISAKISRICEFRVIMGIMTGLLRCCSSSTRGSRANDYVKTTQGFWLHHSPCSLGCWTNNTLAARSLSPKPDLPTTNYRPATHYSFRLIITHFNPLNHHFCLI